jgi:hypothetical protein
MRGADVGDGLRRQDQGVAGDGVDLFRRHGAARQQLRRAAEEVADLERAFGGVLDPANRAGLALDLVPHHRLRHRPHVELGIERAGDALDHDHSLLQQQKFRPGAHVEQAGDLDHAEA